MFTSLPSGLNAQVYPPCLATQRTTNYKKTVIMQLERRTPPLILTPSRFNGQYKLWQDGIRDNTSYLKQQSFRQFPKYTENLNKVHINVPNTVYMDTPTETVFEIILKIRDMAQRANRVQHDFYLTSPYSLDTGSFDEKMLAYITNFAHIGAVGSSSGKDHAETLRMGFNLQHNSESINNIFNKICSRLLCPETDLYKVEYTRFGINCRYISAFIDHMDPTKLVYLLHSWQTNYFCPEQEDVEALALLKGADFPTDEPFLDGWGRLVTVFCKREGRLKPAEQAFVERRNLATKNDFRLIRPGDQEEFGNWRIGSKDILLANAADWRGALPLKDKGKDYGFLDVPESHCLYNPSNYPYDLFGPGDLTQIQRPVSTLPYGDFYGIKEYKENL